MADYSKHLNVKSTPQSQPIPGKKMIANRGGGYGFQITPEQQLLRFLILGSAGGTYYAGEREMTVENAANIIEMIKTPDMGKTVVQTILDVSVAGSAPKNDPAIFSLALACVHGDANTKHAAYNAISKVCRTGTHLFSFCQAVRSISDGFLGRGLKKGVSRFYTDRTTDGLAYQLIKYRQRDGWTHRDVLRLAHPKAPTLEHNMILKYAVGKGDGTEHRTLSGFELLQHTTDAKIAASLITDYKLPREAVPTTLLGNKLVWEALLQEMPLTALIRNLGKMTNINLLANDLSASTKFVVDKLTDAAALKKARVHPLTLLTAIKIYGHGAGDKGSLTWSPIRAINDALDDAFYASFGNIEPTGKNTMLALDVSGSMMMSCSKIAGSPLHAAEAAAALAMVTARTEQKFAIMAFSNTFIPLNISKKASFADAMKIVTGLPFSSTDCALPMIYAGAHKLDVDTFVVLTDNETNFGRVHPYQALKTYRQVCGKAAKLAVMGMTATDFSIADPIDSGTLDLVGFDSASPQILSAFSRGEV